jgi:membrane protease YdiL (CAAX protease family)
LIERVATKEITLSIMSIEVGSPLKNSRIASQGDSVARRWLELCLLMLIAFGGWLLNSVYFHRHGNNIFPLLPNELRCFGIFQEVAALALLGYMLSRRNIRWRDLGLRWSIHDLLSGFLIALLSYSAYWSCYHLLLTIHNAFLPSAPFTREPNIPYGWPPVMLILFYLLNPFFEELIVRAYLMTEVKALTGSWTLAAGLSTLFQASYHIHYGWPVTISLGIQFLVFSVYYARKQRATPLIVAHGIFDISWWFLWLI